MQTRPGRGFNGGNIGARWRRPDTAGTQYQCPVLGLFGEEDANPTPDFVNEIDAEMTRLGKAHEFHQYADAGHGFHCDGRPSGYRPESAADAWGKAMAWFDANLK